MKTNSAASTPTAYGFQCEIKNTDIAAGGTRVTEALKAEGFGILADIDVQAGHDEDQARHRRPAAPLGILKLARGDFRA